MAFFHKKTRTLLVTDAVVYVSDQVSGRPQGTGNN